MRPAKVAAALMTLGMFSATGYGYAADKVDFGKHEYDSNCAICHGLTGKGDGPYAGLVMFPTPDLTTISKRNKGVFPFQHVYDVIDGTETLKAHGTRDMPIWGREYRVRMGQIEKAYPDVPYDPAAYVRAQILALIDYLNRLQAK
jgi:mono/diheme cytochrome c family protein